MEENNAETSAPRIYFGSLEEKEKLSRENQLLSDNQENEEGVDLNEIGDDSNYELTEALNRAREQQTQILQEFERKKRARELALPTDDKRVRLKLREIGEPQCLFAEGPGDRRNRLRMLLSKSQDTDQVEIHSESSSSSTHEQTEDFFAPGTDELLQARKAICLDSLPKAKQRINSFKEEYDVPLAHVKTLRQDLYKHMRTYANFSSQVGDDRPLSQCKFSPDSQYLASASWSGLIKLWSVPNCDLILTLKGHTSRVGGIAFHPLSTSNQWSASVVNLASGGADTLVHLWSLEKKTPLATLEGHEQRVSRIGFHPSGKYLGTTSFDATWRLWDVETTSELLVQEGHSREVYDIAFQCDGSLVATGGLDGIGRVWDLRTGRSIMILQGHSREILGVDFSPNGYHIGTSSEDNSLRIWDVRTLRSQYTIAAHKSLVSDLQFYQGDSHQTNELVDHPMSIKGKYCASCSYDGQLKLWSSDDWKLIHSIHAHEGKVMGLDISRDNKFIVTCGYDRTFKLWCSDQLVF